ncbi:GIY-YIG nuclease family protein [Winogradskyella forsetii]|uniref:GIY-YIG nuclease family protein n=1 Tax=Winogradskyella forsetii TaxID=2686077 RepID=UPI0015BF61AF|nr:GIY-YIG nuclease family protein [Winogradskyella forsetii]
MHSLYIIYSKSLDKFYTGESASVELRLILHNNHHFKKAFTNAAIDWEIVLNYSCKTKNDAVYLERFVKRMKSKKFILKLVNDNDILTDILNKR